MKKQQLDMLWAKHLLLDPDYIVDVLGITTDELLEAFSTRFIEYLESEYNDDEQIEAGYFN